jgi:CRISPR-associated protein Csb2
MLTIEVRWLGRAARASSPSNRAAPEWPPSPDRLFQALVATAYETDRMPAVRDWLARLEQAPPQLTVPDALLGSSKRVFVPTNFAPDHKRDERRLPAAYPLSDRLAYHWPGLQADGAAAALVADLTHLGRASSLVAARLVEHSELAPQWTPDVEGHLKLRVPFDGRLAELDAAYASGTKASLAPPRGYALIGAAGPIGAASPWGVLIVRSLDGRLPAWQAVPFADAVRTAVLSRAGDGAPAALHGHDAERRAHVAIVPLPDVGRRHARGLINGVMFCLPAHLSDSERATIQLAIGAVEEVRFGGESLRLERIAGEPARSLDLRRWCRPARVWHTVTPIVFDVFPRRNLTAERAVARSIVNAGYPPPIAISVSPFASIEGVERSAAHVLRESSRRAGAPYSHATVVFDSPVRGPLVVGRERHFGGGLLLPASDDTTDAV